MATLLILGVFLLGLLFSAGISALIAWVLWLIYTAVAPSFNLPPIDFLIVWGFVFVLRMIFSPRSVTVNR